jgi:hypothetical protein
MVRIVPLIAALFSASAMLAGIQASPAAAQAPAFRAVPATPLTKAENVIVGELLWKCAPDGCIASNTGARPAIVCAQAARKVGKLDSFSAGTVAFDAEAMAKCNAKAKG